MADLRPPTGLVHNHAVDGEAFRFAIHQGWLTQPQIDKALNAARGYVRADERQRGDALTRPFTEDAAKRAQTHWAARGIPTEIEQRGKGFVLVEAEKAAA